MAKWCAWCAGFWLLGVALVFGVLLFGPDGVERLWA